MSVTAGSRGTGARERHGNLMPSEFDLAVIGSGMGGVLAADAATDLGARVALIEKDRIGGT